jgi:hypothetical protein
MVKRQAPKKATLKRREIKHTDLALEDLKKIEGKKSSRTDRPKTLKVEQILTAQNVFQWRGAGDRFRKLEHIKELGRVLRDGGSLLDPLLVIAVGQEFFVVEGHHRLEAYAAQGWTKGVPVTYFTGSVTEARERALYLNIKDKLALTREEKSEAAWQLMIEGSWLRKAIVDTTSVSLGTLKNMARVLREYPEAANERWAQARSSGSDPWTPEDGWDEKEAARLAEGVLKVVGAMWRKYPTVVARALELADDDLPGLLISQWRERVEEQVEFWAEEDKRMHDLL